jgi:hypothetical protein
MEGMIDIIVRRLSESNSTTLLAILVIFLFYNLLRQKRRKG